MSDTVNNKNVKDDEIDLLDLFRRMGRGLGKMFRAIGKGMLISFVFLVRGWLPLSISVVLGIAVSIFVKKATPSFYTSDLILKVNIPSTADLISHINRLHIYCKERNINELAQSLAIQESQLRNIMDISAYWIIDQGSDGIPDIIDSKDNHNIYDTLNIRMQDRFAVRVRINEPQELNNVKIGIMGYINSDSLFQQRNRMRTFQNRALLTRIDYDIKQLDSLQKVKYFEETRNRMPQSGGQIVFVQEQRTQLLYTDIYQLYDRKQSIEREQSMYPDIVTILSDFSIPAQRENGLVYYAARYVPVLFMLTLIILILLASRKKIKELFEKY